MQGCTYKDLLALLLTSEWTTISDTYRLLAWDEKVLPSGKNKDKLNGTWKLRQVVLMRRHVKKV